MVRACRPHRRHSQLSRPHGLRVLRGIPQRAGADSAHPRHQLAMAARRRGHRRDRPRRRRAIRRRCSTSISSLRTPPPSVVCTPKAIAVICYMETGAWESYRPDASRYPEEVLGNHVEGFPEERFVDIRQVDVLLPILEARLDTRRFEGVRRNRARPRRHLQRIRHRVPADPGSPAGLQPRRRRCSSRTRSLDRSEERGVT